MELLARPKTGREILSPVWGPGGQWVAWSESDGVEGRIRVMAPSGEQMLEHVGFPAFCLDPSPDGGRLAQLASGPLGLELSVVELDTGATSLVARGAPLYWAWGPRGDRLIVHVEQRVFIAQLAALGGAVVEYDLLADVDRFLCPWWSPAGGEVIFVDDSSNLVAYSLDGDAAAVIASGQAGYRFTVDRSGQRVALVTQHASGAVLDVIDRLTGERVTAVDEPVAGMWWSADGGRLLSLVRAGDPEQPFVRWNIWDGSANHLLPPFQPSRVVAETILPFFEQFSAAHHFWSADGSRVVTPGIMRDGRNEIFVQEVAGPPPEPVTDGVMAWWSPAPT